MTKTQSFAYKLLAWWDQFGRKDLPWQQDKTPYRVWVSEIMLQQTQVASVIEYYQRFMASFPNIETLAKAHEDQVLEHWAGLGYYARARNLHKTARIIVEEHQGEFPNTLDEIIALPGIGRSTAGAILSIAFKQPTSILDGNVKRVLCRFKAIRTWPGERQTEQQLWDFATDLTPDERTDDYTQAIMDLGATLCTRRQPSCTSCPMSNECRALEQSIQNELPKSKPKKASPTKQTWLLHIINERGEILLEKRPPTGIWGGLYSLPEHSFEDGPSEVKKACVKKWQLTINSTERQKSFTHVFSHYKLHATPILMQVKSNVFCINEDHSLHWVSASKLKEIGLPAPIEKYLQQRTQPELALTIE